MVGATAFGADIAFGSPGSGAGSGVLIIVATAIVTAIPLVPVDGAITPVVFAVATGASKISHR